VTTHWRAVLCTSATHSKAHTQRHAIFYRVTSVLSQRVKDVTVTCCYFFLQRQSLNPFRIFFCNCNSVIKIACYTMHNPSSHFQRNRLWQIQIWCGRIVLQKKIITVTSCESGRYAAQVPFCTVKT
jgi:hypothetical protein